MRRGRGVVLWTRKCDGEGHSCLQMVNSSRLGRNHQKNIGDGAEGQSSTYSTVVVVVVVVVVVREAVERRL